MTDQQRYRITIEFTAPAVRAGLINQAIASALPNIDGHIRFQSLRERSNVRWAGVICATLAVFAAFTKFGLYVASLPAGGR